MMSRIVPALSLLTFGFLTASCSSSPVNQGARDAGSGGATDARGTGGGGPAGDASSAGPGGAGGASSAAGGAGGPIGTVGTTQCSDGLDNDGDGKIDLQDPECVSPLDNDESSFATGIHGDNMDACKQDCFFDGNSGMGDDGCNWDLSCDPANIGAGAARSCPYDPSTHNCPTAQSAKCVANCGPVTPNGCDCVGCCVVPGVNHPIRLDASCTAANFNDPALCPACTQQPSCTKTCDKCQLCLGKTTLDPSCATVDGGAPTPVCPSGQTVCGTDPNLCMNNTLCVTGCCVPWIF